MKPVLISMTCKKNLTSSDADSQSREKPDNSIRVLPKEAPPALTEEERQRRVENEQYEKKIRYLTLVWWYGVACVMVVVVVVEW